MPADRDTLIRRHGLEAALRIMTGRKQAQRRRKRFAAGKAVFAITLTDGTQHPAGCECYDCLFGEGKAIWEASLAAPLPSGPPPQPVEAGEVRVRMRWNSRHQTRPIGGAWR